jgi:two-component system, NarL family, nitrate/nitrite response regulator NarL
MSDPLVSLVCDDHPLVRQALKGAVASVTGGEVLTAGDYHEAWLCAERTESLGLIVADLHMPGAAPLDGVAELRRRRPAAKLLVVSGSGEDSELLGLVHANIDGFLPKTADTAVLDAALRMILAGGRFLPQRLAELAAHAPPPAPRGDGPASPRSQGRLSERQVEVLRMLAEGRSNKEIARELALSPATVKTHVAHIMAVLAVGNRTEAAARARSAGLI